jgi:AcrR family transcriptional regulator
MSELESSRRRPRGTREQTRRDLVDAAMTIIRRDGIGALTTVRVTAEAGLAQSGFYSHFNNMDECVREASKQIATRIRTSVAEHRKELYAKPLGDPKAAVDFYRAILGLFAHEHQITKVMFQNQGDGSQLGKMMRKTMKSMRDDLFDDLWRVGQAIGLKECHRHRVEILAEMIMGSVVSTATAMLNGKLKDRELLAGELAALTSAAAANLASRCLSET